MIYFDSTYLVRCYFKDPGFGEVRALAASERVACAQLGQVEVAAAFHRKLREGTLTPALFEALIRQFDAELDCFTWAPVTSSIVAEVRRRFAALPANVYLRSADALHLVCAQAMGLSEVYTNDRHMVAAAPHFGLRGVNIIPAQKL